MNETEIEEACETFMQNSTLLIDTNYEMQAIILSILARMCIIRYHNFGLYCFNTLKDLMKSGSDMEDQVIFVLKNEVICKMNQVDPTEIPVQLLQGLYELVDDSKKPDLLYGMFDNFPQWLRQLIEKIEFCKKQGQ